MNKNIIVWINKEINLKNRILKQNKFFLNVNNNIKINKK
jgi:hypothetical protein